MPKKPSIREPLIPSAGAMANDNVDGNITSNIIPTITDASGNTIAAIDANTPVGTYTITYNVMDGQEMRRHQ